MGKKCGAVLGIFVFIAAGMWFFNQSRNSRDDNATQGKPVVKIGLAIPLLGAIVEGNETAKAGAKLAMEDIAGGDLDFELIVEESSFDLRSASAIASKLIDRDKVHAVVSLSSTGGNVISPMAKKNNLLHISLCSDPNVADGRNNFIHWPVSDRMSEKLVDLAQKNNVRKVNVFYTSQSGAKAIADDTARILEKNGIQVVLNAFNPNEKDFKTVIYKASQDESDLWILLLYTPSLENFVKTMQEMNVSTPITAAEVITYSSQKELFEGVEYVDSPIGDATLQKRKKAVSKSDNMLFVPFVYDAIRLIAKVNSDFYVANGRLPNGNEMTEGLHKIGEFQGQVGKVLIDENGVFQSKAVIKKIVNGKPVIVEE